MSIKSNCQEIFCNLSSKVTNLLYSRTEGDLNSLNEILDCLNSLNYKYSVITNKTQAILLINQCCTFVPVDDVILATKCCKLITNIVNLQEVVVEGRTLTVSILWCLEVLKQDHVTLDVLTVLDALLRSNLQHAYNLLPTVVVENGPFLKLFNTDGYSSEIKKYAFQCLVAITTITEKSKVEEDHEKHLSQYETCGNIFLKYLVNTIKSDDINQIAIIILCLKGLENIIVQNNDYFNNNVGFLLGIVKSYMLYGLKNLDYLPPQNIIPSTLSLPEPIIGVTLEKKGGKLTKQRKHRTQKKESKNTNDWVESCQNNQYTPANNVLSFNLDTSFSNNMASSSKLKTSDSDFSDTEGGKVAKLSKTKGRVRQAALSLFLKTSQSVDKHIIFSYWASFIPENSLSGKYNLITSILDDPSPRGRMAALNVLLHFITSSKLFLLQAEISNCATAFTPFSITLGYMIKELHRCLSLALNENVLPVLIQVLKCLAALVQSTPYHRLSSGLITKVVRNMKCFISYKDATVQVGALIVLGCILASEPTIPETYGVFFKIDQPKKSDNTVETDTSDIRKERRKSFNFVEFSSDEEEEESSPVLKQFDKSMSWILEKCLRNLGLCEDNKVAENNVQSPVKVESLQVISAMTRNYFVHMIYPHLVEISQVLEFALRDKLIDVKLHAGRTIDFIGQAMAQHFSIEGQCPEESKVAGVTFWQTLLNGSLTSSLQHESEPTVRAVACDCLGSIGPHLFQHLPGDKQILCITLLFASTRNEENTVRGAAIRALALSVLYPNLREDIGFVIDTSEAIYRALEDENVQVKIKASWSLGNLSDSLVLNRFNDNFDEFPNSLLRKLFEISVKLSKDNDKIKMNVVRALGNLLQLIVPHLLKDDLFKNIVNQAMMCLVKASSTGSKMKVRWNSCYAIGNALKNECIYQNSANWQKSLFAALCDLVINFKNFKVRINAALALSSPAKREFYGIYYKDVWMSLLKALENSEHVENFLEYKHRDHLVEQICLSLAHLMSLSTNEDLEMLNDSLSFYFDILKTQMHRVYERLVPEKSSVLYTAASHVKKLNGGENLKGDQMNALCMLSDVFIYEIL